MVIPSGHINEFRNSPAALRKLVEDEHKTGNDVVEYGHGFPAAPCGAYIILASPVKTRVRATTAELKFYDRDTNKYSGDRLESTLLCS